MSAFPLDLWATGLAPVLALMFALWIASLVVDDVSIVDPAWSLLFVAAGTSYVAVGPDPARPRAWLALALVSVWALRLALYLAWRKRREGEEDRRYRAMRRRFGPSFRYTSLGIVFGPQGLLAWVVSLPLAGSVSSPAPLGWLDAAGVALFLVGLVFESVGDLQLARFKADPANAGRVLDTGLWRYTRHPNYFGDFCVWWGLFLVAAGGGAWWSLPGPLLMSVLLLRVSGVTLLEHRMEERRPAYADYVRRTNAFFPGPPREN